MKMLINLASGEYLTDQNVRALAKHVQGRQIIRAISLKEYNGTIYIRGFYYDAEEYGSMLDKDGEAFVKEIADLCKLSGVGRVIIVPNLAMYPRVEFGAIHRALHNQGWSYVEGGEGTNCPCEYYKEFNHAD